MSELSFSERCVAVQSRIVRAAARSGRSADAVTLVAVSKTFPPECITEAASCGLRVFGESRVQEALEKMPQCPGQLEWHFIGHLQRNKVKFVVPEFAMIHGVDSLRLLETIEAGCDAQGCTMPVCLQLNVSGERSKFGMSPEALPAVLEAAAEMRGVQVVGLMTIPPYAPDPEAARPFFARLRECRDQARDESGFPLDHLSMGMSHDFEVAVEEGATLVRIGSALFGKRQSMRRDG